MALTNPRFYGNSPYHVALVHGGPGAVGEMAPVARALAADFGVLEPLQTSNTLQGQVDELAAILVEKADLPVTLVGYSWGAWLSYIVAAAYPERVKKLILVGSGPFEQHYAARIQTARAKRLSESERAEYEAIIELLSNPGSIQVGHFARLGQLTAGTDHFDPLPDELFNGELTAQTGSGNAYHGVLQEAQQMRANGALLTLAQRIHCPVVALHGDYDPHPAEGVFEPLSSRLGDFRFIELAYCGHKPWIERFAKNRFCQVLRSELRET